MANPSGGMGRLLGLGFVFGAQDRGASRVTSEVSEGFDRVTDSVRQAGRASGALQRLGNAISALNFMQLDRIGDSLEGLAERAGINPQDTGLESFGVEFANTFRRATVGLGPFREQVEAVRGEIGSLAYSLDIDANDMIGAVTRVARTGNDLDDFGVSLRAVAGSIQANILSGEQLGDLLAGLSETYELGAEGAGQLVDRVTAIGEAFGFGADAVRRLPEVISAADPVLARFTGLTIDDVTESVTRLSVAMSRGLGVSFEEGSQAAIELFNSLSEARAGLTDIVTGVGSDFPELATELGIATGDIDEAMQSILSDPVTFAARMRDLMSTMDRSSPAFHRLQGAMANLPANFRFLITGGEEVGEALTAAQQPIGDFEGAFNRMARSGAGTARTFGESMQRLEDAFQTRLNRMTSITTSEVLGRQRAAYQRMGDYLERWAGDDGALGLLTQGFLNVRRYGLVHGLLPMLEQRLASAFPNLAQEINTFAPILGDLAEGFGTVAMQAGPMLLVLNQLGAGRAISSAFGALRGGAASIAGFLGPWGLLVGGIAAGAGAIWYYWDDISTFFQTTDWQGLAHDAAQGFMGGLDSLLDWSENARESIQAVDWVAVGQAIGDGVRVAINFLQGLFTGEFNDDVRQFFMDAFEMSPEDAVATISTTLRTILQNTVGQLDTIFHDVMTGIFGEDSGWVTLFDTLFGMSPLGAIQRALDSDSIGEAIFNILGIALGPLFNLANTVWEDIFGESLFDTLSGATDAIVGFFEDSWIVAAITDFVDFWMANLEAAGEMWDEIIVPLADIFWEVVTEMATAFGELWDDTLKPVLDMFWEWWDGPFQDDVVEGSVQGAQSTGDAFRRMWRQTIKPALYDFIRTALDIAIQFQRAYQRAWQSFGREAVTRIFDVIIAIRTFRTNFETARDVLAAGWQLIGARIRRFFTQPILQAGDYFMSIFENIETSVQSLRLGFLRIVQSLVTGLQTAFNAIPAPLRAAMGIVGEGLNTAVDSISREVTSEERRMADAQRAIQAQRQERQREIAAYDAEVARTEAELAATRQTRQRRLRDEAAGAIRARDNLIEGMDRFSDRADDALVRMRERVGELGEATPTVPVGGGETELGSDAPVVARSVEEDEGGGARERGRGRRGRAGGTPAQVRARARRQAAVAADEARTRDTAREMAREMVISAFGPEAVRQLSGAMGGRRGGGGGRRGSRQGGDPAEMGG